MSEADDTRPMFLRLTNEERRAWADQKISRDFLAWVAWEVERGNAAVVDLVYQGRTDLARITTGKIAAMHEIFNAINYADPLTGPDAAYHTDFVDPATRPSLLRRRNAQGK